MMCARLAVRNAARHYRQVLKRLPTSGLSLSVPSCTEIELHTLHTSLESQPCL